jgi:MoaD family protein
VWATGKVTVTLFGNLVNAAGGRKKVEVSATIVSEALAALISQFGEKFKNELFDTNGEVRGSLSFLVNNRNTRFLKQLETELKEGDQLTILPAVGGG